MTSATVESVALEIDALCQASGLTRRDQSLALVSAASVASIRAGLPESLIVETVGAIYAAARENAREQG